MRFKRSLGWLVLLALIAAACTFHMPVALPTAATVTASPTPTATLPPPLPVATATSTPSGPRTLRVWLPPQFAPDETTPAGMLLQARLADWQTAHPDILLDVRVKSEDGPANLLDSLAKTRAAAPGNLPDLVLMRRSDMESAAAAGVLHPLNGLTLELDDADWFPAARELAHIQNTPYGLPAAMDVMVLVYRPGAFPDEVSPQTWIDFETNHVPVAFDGGNLKAYFPFFLYQTGGGLLQNADGVIAFDPEILRQVLDFYAEGYAQGLFAQTTSAYVSADEAWQAFRRGETDAVVTWLSLYLHDEPDGAALMLLPGLDGSPHAMADGWSFALAGAVPEQETAATRLAEYLVEADFLSGWMQAAGYLPPRPTAAALWTEAPLSPETLNGLGAAARLLPPQEQSDVLAARLQQAVLDVLQGRSVDEVMSEITP